jgi:hypothetical protein
MIAPRVQDRAVRFVSGRRLRGLEFIPGEVMIKGQRIALGKHLYLCASSFGLVSHFYLTASAKLGERIVEQLGIERNDTRPLSAEAQRVQELLVRYGIFDDSALTVALDDRQKKPVYVFNRILCPTFSMSFRRDSNLRLSVGKFEMFLLHPDTFARRGTRLLRSSHGKHSELGLFDQQVDDE